MSLLLHLERESPLISREGRGKGCMTLVQACFITIMSPQLKVWPDYHRNKLTVGELWLGFLR